MGDGTGAVMLDGKMEDDASLKQCQVMLELAERLAATDPELAQLYAAAAALPPRRRRGRLMGALTAEAEQRGIPAASFGALHAVVQRAGAGEGQDARRSTP